MLDMTALHTPDITHGYVINSPIIPDTRRRLRNDVRDALLEGSSRIVIDCETWQELDLPLLGVLVQCATECERAGAQFELTHLSQEIRASVHALRLGTRLGL